MKKDEYREEDPLEDAYDIGLEEEGVEEIDLDIEPDDEGWMRGYSDALELE